MRDTTPTRHRAGITSARYSAPRDVDEGDRLLCMRPGRQGDSCDDRSETQEPGHSSGTISSGTGSVWNGPTPLTSITVSLSPVFAHIGTPGGMAITDPGDNSVHSPSRTNDM